MIENGLRALLRAESTITALVNDDDVNAMGEHLGVYVGSAPQGARTDYVLITTLDDRHHLTLSGVDRGDLLAVEVDIDCYSSTSAGAAALAETVITYLDDFTGSAGDETIKAVVFQGRTAGTEPPASGQGHHLHVHTCDFMIHYTR